MVLDADPLPTPAQVIKTAKGHFIYRAAIDTSLRTRRITYSCLKCYSDHAVAGPGSEDVDGVGLFDEYDGPCKGIWSERYVDADNELNELQKKALHQERLKELLLALKKANPDQTEAK